MHVDLIFNTNTGLQPSFWQLTSDDLIGFLELPLGHFQSKKPAEGWHILAHAPVPLLERLWQRMHGVPPSAELWVRVQISRSSLMPSTTENGLNGESCFEAEANGIKMYADLVFVDQDWDDLSRNSAGNQAVLVEPVVCEVVKTNHWLSGTGAVLLPVRADQNWSPVSEDTAEAQMEREGGVRSAPPQQHQHNTPRSDLANCLDLCKVDALK